MFSRAMTNEKKDQVLKQFCSVGAKLGLVVATTAFGLGIDCPDIRQVIHWGILEQFFIEERTLDILPSKRLTTSQTLISVGVVCCLVSF